MCSPYLESAAGRLQRVARDHVGKRPPPISIMALRRARRRPHETPWVVTLPLVLLAIPSLVIGYIAIGPMVFGDFFKMAIPGTGNIPVIFIDANAHPAMAHLAEHFHGAAAMGIHALTSLPFVLALAGVVLSWFFYMKRPDIPAAIQRRFTAIYTLLDNKYYFDKFNEAVFGGGARLLGKAFWRGGDVAVIDGVIVDGSARLVSMIAAVTRTLQTGYVYHYAFTMIIVVFVLMTLSSNFSRGSYIDCYHIDINPQSP